MTTVKQEDRDAVHRRAGNDSTGWLVACELAAELREMREALAEADKALLYFVDRVNAQTFMAAPVLINHACGSALAREAARKESHHD